MADDVASQKGSPEKMGTHIEGERDGADDADKALFYKAADEIIKQLNRNTLLIESTPMTIEYYYGRGN